MSTKSFAKIRKTCEITISNGLQYVWVDTCCIDKSSSAELSEAINSIFQWYKDALVCYAYLSDVPAGGQIERSKGFRSSSWFTKRLDTARTNRTNNTLVFDTDWNMRAPKMDLYEDIEAITGIDQWVLNGSTPLPGFSLAKRMSWAAGRSTTRVEDLTYCLLGTFQVNMPMIYGFWELSWSSLHVIHCRREFDQFHDQRRLDPSHHNPLP